MNQLDKIRYLKIKKRESKRNNLGFLLLFYLIWPFGAFVAALKRFRMPGSKWIVWLFYVFFGFVFIHSYNEGADSYAYVQRLKFLYENEISFKQLMAMVYSEESSYVDLYQPVTTWVVSLFTDNPRWLFMVFAAVLGWFSVQSIWMIFDRIDKRRKVDLTLFLFMAALMLVLPIWQINGVRMWTAANVFIYGLFRFILYNDKRGLYWIFLTVFFHFSFFVPVGFFLAFLLIPRNTNVLFVLFILSSFISELDLELIRNSLSFLPDFLEHRVESYTNEEYYQQLTESAAANTWHLVLARNLYRYILYLWTILVFVNRKFWIEKSAELNKLFQFGLFFGTFAQVLSNMPSGGRFMTLVNFIMFALFVLFISDKNMNNRIRVFQIITLPFILFVVVFRFRLGLDFIGISTFLGNSITALFIEDSVPVMEFIKRIF